MENQQPQFPKDLFKQCNSKEEFHSFLNGLFKQGVEEMLKADWMYNLETLVSSLYFSMQDQFNRIFIMSVVKINEPVKLKLEVVEYEEVLPSIKVSLQVEIGHSSGSINYNVNDIWFECRAWDEFVSGLNRTGSEKDKVVLTNMSDDLEISVGVIDSIHLFSIKWKKFAVGNAANVFVNYEGSVNLDVLSNKGKNTEASRKFLLGKANEMIKDKYENYLSK